MEIPPLNLVIPDFGVGPIPTIQSAINQAAGLPPQSNRAAVWIPSTYPGNDTYTNPSGVPIFDMRFPGSISFGNGALLPNTGLSFSATPSFNVAQSSSYSMTLTGNVTSSTTSGTPANGTLLSLTLIQDATGGRTFSFPANFVFPVGYSFDSAATHTNALTFKFDGTNWNLISNSGTGSGGGNPAGATNTIQKNSSGSFGASSLTDTGSLVSTTADFQFAGPNPHFDIRAYGARSASITTTGTINATSNSLTVGVTSFINGDGIVVRGAGATNTMSTPSAPTVAASNARSLVGTNLTTPNTTGSTTYQYQVVARDIGGGYTAASTATVITNGPATLGANTATVSSWTRSNTTVTVTTTAPHNLTTGAQVVITGDTSIGGTWALASATPGGTTFTFTQGEDSRNGAATSGPGGGTITYYLCNHITVSHVAGASAYYIYGRTSGSMNLIGVTLIDNNVSPINIDPMYNVFDDFGSTMSVAPTLPEWVPSTPPVSAKNDDLVTTVTAGGGTTTLTLAAAATNSVAGATVKFDNAPTISAAITAATTSSQVNGVVYIPALSGGSSAVFATNSVISAGRFPKTISIIQAGNLALGDTLYLGSTVWKGWPQNPQGNPSFAFGAYVDVQSSTAFPMVYSQNQVQVDHLNFVQNSVNGVIWLDDKAGNNIPGSTFQYCNFASNGSTDYTSHHMVIRSNAAGWFMSYITMAPGNASPTNSPLFIDTQIPGNPYSWDHIFLSFRGLYFGSGTRAYFDWIYEQGAQAPKIFIGNVGGGATGTHMVVRNSIEDTTQQPIVTYSAGLSGEIFIELTNGLSGFPIVQGDGLVAVSFFGPGTSISSTSLGQNVSTETLATSYRQIDGILNTSSIPGGKKKINAGVGLGTSYQVFVDSLVQAAPTCSVSAGGSVANGSYTFQVAPVFASGGEGPLSAASTTCTTTTGNQTITITWATVPGATGYDLYQNGFSFQCSPPWVSPGTATSYVWTSAAPCGQSAPQTAGSGPTYLASAAVGSPKVTVEGNGYKTDITAPSNSANRTITLPDASGTIALTPAGTAGFINNHVPITNTLGQLADGVPPMGVFDSGTRANGNINTGNANWTIPASSASTPQITSNAFTSGGNGGNGQNYALYTGVTWPVDDVTVSAVVGGGSVHPSGVILRGSTSAATAYYFGGSIGGVFCINKFVSGTFTSLSCGAANVSSGATITFNANQTNLTAWVNGVAYVSTTDSSIAAGGYPGMWFFSTSAASFTSWQASYGGVTLNSAQTWSGVQTFGSGIKVSGSSSTLSATSGNSGTVAQSSGSLTNGDLASFDSNGNVVDSGIVASSITTKLSNLTAATGSNTIASGNNPQTWNWAQTSNSQTAITFGETSAATSGTLGSQYEVKVSTATGSTAVPLNVTGSLTGSQTLPALHITPTWNTTGVVDAALLINATNTASGTGSLLADFQIGGTSEWKVDKAGNTTQLGIISAGSLPPACTPGTAGGSCLNEGTAPTNGSGSLALYADSTAHELKAATNGTNNFGLLVRTQPGAINQTGQTASISTATLCAASAGACNVAGQYHISWNIWGSGTACSNVAAGSVSFNLTWTDENGTAHSGAVMPMSVQTGATTTAVQSTMPFQTALANESGSGDVTISSNGAAAIQYSTTYTACTTGTGTYNLRATVTRLQ